MRFDLLQPYQSLKTIHLPGLLVSCTTNFCQIKLRLRELLGYKLNFELKRICFMIPFIYYQ